MATLNLNPALGRASGSFTVAGCTVNATTGVITVGTIKTITGQILTLEVEQQNETENISPSTSRQANNVIIESAAVINMDGYLFAADTIALPTNYLFTIVEGFDYIQVAYTWCGRTGTFYGVIRSYKEGVQSKGKLPFSATFEQVDIGAANPAFA